MLTDLVSNHAHFFHVYTVLRLRGRTPDAGSDPPFAPQCNANHLPRLRGLTLLLCSSKFVGFDPTCGVWHRFLCVCKQKTGSAPAMYGTFPWVAREISYLSSFILPRLRGLLLEWDHCVNAGQWNPPPPPPKTDLIHLPVSTPESGHCVKCKRGIIGKDFELTSKPHNQKGPQKCLWTNNNGMLPYSAPFEFSNTNLCQHLGSWTWLLLHKHYKFVG